MARDRPLYLDRPSGPVFGLFSPPGGASASVSVVIVPPFGWQDTSSYRCRRDWAQALAELGYPTLRIDLPGTADSAGAPRDGNLLPAWTDAVAAAAAWSRDRPGCERIAVIGIGLGGLVALKALDQGAPIEDLALWGVPGRGRAVVRELRAFGALEAAQPSDPGIDAAPAVPDGAIAAAGFLLASDTASALSALEVSELSLGGARRALMLSRDGMAIDARLSTRLRDSGVELRAGDGPGYADMMMTEPYAAVASQPALAAITDWLAAVRTDGPQTAPPAADAHAVIACADGLVREQPCGISWGGDGELFGILAEPAASADAAPITVVLLNAGAQRRTGPNRIWVEAARRWAARYGVPSLRLDLEGIGDADGEAKKLVDVAGFYVPGYIDQVRAALDALVARGLPSRFVLMGLCSGAYWGFHTALVDDRVEATIMLNPRLLHYESWIEGSRDVRRYRLMLLQPKTWKRVLRGETPWKRVRGALRHALAAPLRLHERRQRERRTREAGGDSLDLLLDSLRDRRQRGFLVFTQGEPLYEDFEREGRLERLGRWPNLEMRFLSAGLTDISGTPDAHTLRPVWLQRQVHEIVDGYLEQILGPLPAPAAETELRQERLVRAPEPS